MVKETGSVGVSGQGVEAHVVDTEIPTVRPGMRKAQPDFLLVVGLRKSKHFDSLRSHRVVVDACADKWAEISEVGGSDIGTIVAAFLFTGNQVGVCRNVSVGRFEGGDGVDGAVAVSEDDIARCNM